MQSLNHYAVSFGRYRIILFKKYIGFGYYKTYFKHGTRFLDVGFVRFWRDARFSRG